MSDLAVQEIFCNRCGDKSPVGSSFCESCGDPFDNPFCACGAELVQKARFCHMCGARVTSAAELSATADDDSPTPPEAPAPSVALVNTEAKEVSMQLRSLHNRLIDIHHKTAAALNEEKKLRAPSEEAHRQAQLWREKASEAARQNDTKTSQEALSQQLIFEKEAAELRARWELAKVACEPLRGELFTLHNQFLEFVDIALSRFAQFQGWAEAEATLQELLASEVSNSRRARILYAIGITARDGLGDTLRAKEAFRQAADIDPKQTQAKEALKSLGG